MDKSIPPLMCNTPPPMDHGFEDEEDEEISVGSIDDSSAPSTPSKSKSLDNAFSVPEELPTIPHTTLENPAKTIHPPEDIFIKDHIDPVTIQQEPPPDVVQSPPTTNEPSENIRCESPPSLELYDPASDDLSFDDPNLDDIPEDDFYTNTELSLPSLRLELIVDSPPDLDPSHFLADASPDQRTEDDLSTASKDLTEEELPTIDTQSLELDHELPLSDTHDSPQSISSADAPCDSHPYPTIDTDKFNEVVEKEFITNVNSNQTKDVLTNISLVPTSEDDFSVLPKQDISNTFDDQTRMDHPLVADEKSNLDNSDGTNESSSFDVDFSQFNAFPSETELSSQWHAENNDEEDDDFGDFNDAPPEFVNDFPTIISAIPQSDFNDGDEDDDFGDFSNHFENTQPTIATLPTTVKDVYAKVDSLLAMMFPSSRLEAEECADASEKSSSCSKVESEDLLNDITLAVRNVDDSKALQHQWLTSTTKGSLVLALGIDSRNILYGGKWNSSVPRFAANLGFTPLEPTKSADGSASGGVRTATDVPAAQFDWTSSGLVNPLDGVQEILHEANVAQNRASRSDANWPLRSTQQQHPEASHLPGGPTSTVQPTPLQISSTSISNDPSKDTHEDDAIPTPISSSYVVPGSGTLKETHIFTPSKVIASFVVDDLADTAARPESGVRIDENVVKKEYHDIEYNPKQSSPVVVDEFSDFQSVEETPQMLQPTQSGIVINWPDPGRLTGMEFDQFVYDDSSKIDNNVVDQVKEEVSMGKYCISIEEDSKPSPKSSILNQFIPTSNIDDKTSVVNDFLALGPNHVSISPSSTLDNREGTKHELVSTYNNGFVKEPQSNMKSDSFDDFSEFQSVPIPVQQAPQVPSMTVIGMPPPLEPTSVLVPTNIQSTTNTPASQIAWPDPGIDSDEMARLEAIFPTPKTISLPNPVTVKSGSPKRQGTVDEVEWTDFVSSSAGLQPITHIINQNVLKHQQEKPAVDDDDWSDFVSSGTSVNNQFNPLPMVNATTGPNFPAWNAPASSFGSWTPTASSLKQSSKQDIAQIQPARIPTVSLIPDLGFVAPAPPSFIRGSAATSSARNNGTSQFGAPVRK